MEDDMYTRVADLKDKLVVSCQALETEPLHSPFIMGRMARAAMEGGAGGIRANSVEDIEEIKKNVNLPIIGIIKQEYKNSNVYITPTMKEVEALAKVRPEIIALDATNRNRPDGKSLEALVKQIKEKYPNQMLLADCSTLEEAIYADLLGFDFIGSTLVGYTEESKAVNIEEDDFKLLKEMVKRVKAKVIAEGNINTPQKAKRAIEIGCYCVVVGSAITRPQLITKQYADAVALAGDNL